jgi:dolichyl-phosphate beta-glucosyltransferase
MGDCGTRQMIAVVIPCFNEAERIAVGAVSRALQRNPQWVVFLVDDGSTDATAAVLKSIRDRHESQVHLLRFARNRGKAEAVRVGMADALERGATLIAYLDADESTPFEELERLIERIESHDGIDVVLGSRVRLLGTDIRRNAMRHIVGRAYGTLASVALGAPVYDTQCGAKVFRRTDCLAAALAQSFSGRWAFDAELLSRLTNYPGNSTGWAQIVEEPLRVWHARDGSKLRPRDGIAAIVGLLRIARNHRRAVRNGPTGA